MTWLITGLIQLTLQVVFAFLEAMVWLIVFLAEVMAKLFNEAADKWSKLRKP